MWVRGPKPVVLAEQQGEKLRRIIRDEWAEDGTTLFLESALQNIREEIALDFELGKVKPFVEGEPIGAYKKRPKVKVVHLTPQQRWLQRLEECATLRARNDAMLTSLERRMQ